MGIREESEIEEERRKRNIRRGREREIKKERKRDRKTEEKKKRAIT